jgi:MatE
LPTMNLSDVANQTSQVFFEEYVETTLDPEWSLIIGSLIACILLHATLPCMLSLGSRYERRQEHKRGRRHVGGGGELTDQDETSDEEDPNELKIHSHNNIDDISTKKPRQPSILLERIQSTPEMSTDADIDNVSETKSSKRKKNKNLSRSKKTKVPKMAPIDEENALVADASQILGVTSSWTVSQAAIQRTSRSSGGSPICSGDGVIQWFCGVAETVRIYKMAMLWENVGGLVLILSFSIQLDRAQLPISRARSSVSLRRRQGSGTKDGVENINKIKKNDSLHSQHQATAIRNVQASDLSQTSSSESRSILSRLHHDDVSFSEAIDKYKNQTITYPTTDNSEIDSGEVDICCGERAWWKPKMIRAALQKLVHVSDIDDEMMALLRTAWPTSAHGFITGLFSLVDISLIGYLVGTKEASVFVLVSLLVWLPTTLTYGLFEALIKFVPESIDHNKMKEAGLYLTTAMGLFSLSMIPIGIFWSFLTKMAFLRLGFDDDFAELAQQYAYIQISIEWLSGIGYCINLFLDIIGHQRFSSYSILVLGFGQTAAIILQTLLGKNSLIYIGLCRSLFASLHVLTTLLLTAWWGWLDKYVSGNSCLPFTVRLGDLEMLYSFVSNSLSHSVCHFFHGRTSLLL